MHIGPTIVRAALVGGALWAVAVALRHAFHIRDVAPDPGDPDVARGLNNFAVGRLREGSDLSAEALFHAAIDLLQCASSPQPDCLATVHANLAALHTARAARARADGRDDLAAPSLRRAIEILESNGLASHLMLARALTNLGHLCRTTGDEEDARRHFERAASMREDARCDSPDHAAENFMALSDVYRALGQNASANARLKHAAAILATGPGHPNPRLGTCLSRRASLAHARGMFETADVLFREARDIKIAALGRDHPSLARTLEDHAALLRSLGRDAEASELDADLRPIRARYPARDPVTYVEALDLRLIALAS